MSVFDDAIDELRRAMQGEPPAHLEEAVTVLSTFGRVHSHGNFRHPGNLAAATRYALAQRDRRADVTPAKLAAAHDVHPPAIARLARTISDSLGLDLPPVTPKVAREYGLKVPKGGGPIRLPLPQTFAEAYDRRRLVDRLRAHVQAESPLHERGPAVENPEAMTLVLRVTLTWKPDVWRDLELRGDQTLTDLHDAIQDAFGWDRDHLWAFFMAPVKGTFRIRSAEPGTVYGGGEDDASPDTALANFGLRTRRRFHYLFDFGDHLLHAIEVRGQGKPEARKKYPRVLETHGRAPPQYP